MEKSARMKNLVSSAGAALAAVVLMFSCAKTHTANPTPSNYRMHSVELVQQTNAGRVYNNLYTFTYDSVNRLSSLIYSSNDTSIPNMVVYYKYATGGKVYKTYYQLNDTFLLRTDSLLLNANGQVAREWTPYQQNTFEYYGPVLSQLVNGSGEATVYTFSEGDFFKCSSAISFDSSETFVYYKTLNNRAGEYLQLHSFINYGQNIYQYAHLMREITSSGYTTEITYDIDADSKITQTNAVVTDSVGNVYNYTYNIAYETH
jgi:hypothetical protein